MWQWLGFTTKGPLDASVSQLGLATIDEYWKVEMDSWGGEENMS